MNTAQSAPHPDEPLRPGFALMEGDCPTHGAFAVEWSRLAVLRGIAPECPTCASERRAREEREAEAKAAKQRREDALDDMNLVGRFREATLDNFLADTAPKRKALDTCRAWVDAYRPNIWAPLWLIGTPGTGKTHLGAAVAQAARFERDTGSIVVTCRELIRDLRTTWRKDSEEAEDDVIERYARVGVLVLDEVGVGFGTDAELTQLYDVLDRRYALRRSVVLVSNLNRPGIKAAIGDRLFDRLQENARVVACDWTSHRQRRDGGTSSEGVAR